MIQKDRKNSNRLHRRISSLFLLFGLLFLHGKVAAQEENGMFLFQIAGNDYIKKSYDEDGELESYQEFITGKTREEKGKYFLPLEIYSYNAEGELEDSMVTTYSCMPSHRKVLMMVFPYTGSSSDKTITVDLHSGNKLYPVEPEAGQKVGNIVFSFSVDGGILGAFGTTSKVSIQDRKVVAVNSSEKTMTLKGRVKVEAFMYDFRISTIQYSIKEVVHFEKGILEQRFENNAGGYFLITIDE